MKTISIQEYANLIGYKGENPTLEEIQDFAENERDSSIWDYPLEELQDILNDIEETKKKFVFVDTDFGVRICEI
jgi:hypothetical protein